MLNYMAKPLQALKKLKNVIHSSVSSYISNPHVFGRIAEYKTMLTFMLKGYLPLKNRYKCKYGEIDLILKRGNKLAFVEVKARSDYLEGEFCDIIGGVVSFKQIQRIQNAAMHYVQTNYTQNDVNNHYSQMYKQTYGGVDGYNPAGLSRKGYKDVFKRVSHRKQPDITINIAIVKNIFGRVHLFENITI